MSSAPWIWPRMTSGFSLGSWETVADAVRVRGSEPDAKLSRWTSSVRACEEFFVVAPSTGAQNVTPPPSAVVSHGGETLAGLTVSASPESGLAIGSVSCQPSRFTSEGVAGFGEGVPEVVQDASARASAATTQATARVERVLIGASPNAGRAVVATAAVAAAAPGQAAAAVSPARVAAGRGDGARTADASAAPPAAGRVDPDRVTPAAAGRAGGPAG